MAISIIKPTVNGSNNSWGTLLNTALDTIVTRVNEINEFPSGGIVMWSGTIANIPSGWNLCDGTNGTPDLTDRFIVGSTTDSGATHDIGDTGGANSTTLTTAQLPAHTHSAGTLVTSSAGAHSHNFTAYRQTGGSTSYQLTESVLEGPSARTKTTDSAGAHTHSISGSTGSVGSGDSVDNRPAYYALAFIMKA